MNWLIDNDAATLVYKGWPLKTVGLVVLAAAILLAVTWVLQAGTAKRWLRAVCTGMRLTAVAILALVLMDPVVRSQELIPQQSYLAHVFDISHSMHIPDLNGTSRIEGTRAVASANASARMELDALYRHADFAFDTDTVSIEPDTLLAATERPTDLEAALRNVQFQVSGLPMSGIVLYSDGNGTVGANLDSTLETARALNIPIYTVGAAPTEPGSDFWIENVVHPAEISNHVDTRVTVLVGARGMAGQRASVSLFDLDGNTIDQKIVPVASNQQVLSVEFDVRPGGADYVVYRADVAKADAEAYPWNNEQAFFMNVTSDERRVLFVEGAPRYEYRFLRAAFEDDERFAVASMVFVTRDNDFYRQGIADASELRQGFPATEEELFAYDVVVIGDISARQFSEKQLDVLNEFVRKRGGGLLFLAGSESFARGGFGNTVLANALPIDFSDPRQSFALVGGHAVAPTALGRERSIFGPYDPATNPRPPWERLPKMEGLFPLYELKPGARALCDVSTRGGERHPVVAFHRYGKGVALVCGVSATWQWKFQTPSDDPSYQAFWKEMVLVLMEGQQDLIQVGANPGVVSVDEETSIRGTVLTETFELNRTAPVALTVASPDGTTNEIASRPTTKEGFTFAQTFTPREPGIYRVTAQSRVEGTGEAIEHEAVFLATSESAELAEIDLNENVLRQIAAASGGEYVHVSEYDQLRDRIEPHEGSLYKLSEDSAWDTTWVLAALLVLLIGEWGIRRAGGLA